MKKSTGSKQSSSGFLTGLLCAIGGVAVGVGAKLLYDELSTEPNQPAKNSKENHIDNIKTNDNKESKEDFNYPTNVPVDMDVEYEAFVCPITQEIMRDPVITPHGISFERSAILEWLTKNPECPFTKRPLKKEDLISNYALKSSIHEYLRKNSKNNSKN